MDAGFVILCLVAAVLVAMSVCALLVEQKRNLERRLIHARGERDREWLRAERAEALVPGAVLYQFPTEGAS